MEFHRSALRSFDIQGRLRMQVRVGRGRGAELTSAGGTDRVGGDGGGVMTVMVVMVREGVLYRVIRMY